MAEFVNDTVKKSLVLGFRNCRVLSRREDLTAIILWTLSSGVAFTWADAVDLTELLQ